MPSIQIVLAAQMAIACAIAAIVACAIAVSTRREIRKIEVKAKDRTLALKVAREKFAELKNSFNELSEQHTDVLLRLEAAAGRADYLDRVIEKLGTDESNNSTKMARNVLRVLKAGMESSEDPEKLTIKIIGAAFEKPQAHQTATSKTVTPISSVAALTR